MREGGGPVSPKGETRDRKATADFWAQLAQAIYHASTPAIVQWLAVMHMPQTGQPLLTARISSAATAQRLYNAILALPLTSPNRGNLQGVPGYQLVFHAADQKLPSVIDTHRNLISLNGNVHTRTGIYTL